MLDNFPELTMVNVDLQEINIPCLILAVKKNRKGHIKELHKKICSGVPGLQAVKMILYVEHKVNPHDLTVALWRFCNNLDPKRDHFLFESEDAQGKITACLGLDGTRKTKAFDGFERDWPNIIVADEKTIANVDAKWHKLGLGAFIPSPSLRYKSQMYGEEAVVEE
ncbi:MAG: UbiD family decarboxylase [Agriterribacter sp.]